MLPTIVVLALTLIQSPAAPPSAAPQSPAPAAPVAPAQAAAPASPANIPAKMAETLRVQVMLDRAGFSPGAIDGNDGKNTRQALALYTGQGGDAAAATDALVSYTITPEDAAGPYTPDIPSDLVEQGKLEALGYKSVAEAIAERFHTTPALLQRLNPGATFEAGSVVMVPNVEPLVPPAPAESTSESAPAGTAGRTPAGRASQRPAGTTGRGAPSVPAKPDVVVTVSKHESALRVTDAAGKVLFFAPVTTGSEHDPLPIGEWKVNGVQYNPTFRYNPELFWDADPSHTKTAIKPGPNNPVGLVWIDISKPHYGLHGTPEPSTVGHVESHGCVRLTNWDALKVASLVKPGTKVVFTE